MKKRILHLSSLLILLFSISFILISCSTKPWEYNEGTLYSKQPEIEIIKKPGEDFLGYIVVENNKIPIVLLWGPTRAFDILEVNEDLTHGVISDETVLLRGRVKSNSKTITLIISVDNIFNNEFKEIILLMKN
jgi:hypothetical protein